MERTDIEKRLDALMAEHPYTQVSDLVQQQLKAFCMRMGSLMEPELLGYLVSQHAAAYIASLKITKVMRPELADLLADDFSETVKRRAFPGVPTLVQPR